VSRLIKEAKKNAETVDSIPHALYNLDKALNKIQQHRPHFKSKQHSEWQKSIDKGTANCQSFFWWWSRLFRGRWFAGWNQPEVAKVFGRHRQKGRVLKEIVLWETSRNVGARWKFPKSFLASWLGTSALSQEAFDGFDHVRWMGYWVRNTCHEGFDWLLHNTSQIFVPFSTRVRTITPISFFPLNFLLPADSCWRAKKLKEKFAFWDNIQKSRFEAIGVALTTIHSFDLYMLMTIFVPYDFNSTSHRPLLKQVQYIEEDNRNANKSQ
jgi:hypothetical protein